DIFFNNSAKNGLLLVQLPEDHINMLFDLSEDDLLHLAIDLEKQLVTHEKLDDMPFDYDPFAKHCLINGMDQLDYMLSNMDKIDAYEAKKRNVV
ncbi:MAG: 3-isopropylmalate dehydratase small subunit, partial [Coxiella sp. (in: Bacteria)]